MRPKMKNLIAIAIAMWPCYQADADVWLTGVGTVPCSKITSSIIDAKAVSEESHGWIRLHYTAWMQGFMGGRNEERRKSDNGIDLRIIPNFMAYDARVERADNYAQLDWVLEWCEENPLKFYYDAVQSLFELGIDAQQLFESIDDLSGRAD